MFPSWEETTNRIMEELIKEAEMESRCYACGQEKPKTILTSGIVVQHKDIRFDYQPYIVLAKQDRRTQWTDATDVVGFKDGYTCTFLSRNLRIVHGYLHIESREA